VEMTKTMNLIQYIEQFRPDLNIPMSVERQRYLTYGFPGLVGLHGDGDVGSGYTTNLHHS